MIKPYLRERDHFVVMATHPDHPNYGPQMRSRKLHLSAMYERKTKTLCNMLVVSPVEKHSFEADRELCSNCLDLVGKTVKQQASPRNYSFTINTDASLYRDNNVAAWACWIRSEHYLIKDAGLFPDDEHIPNSSIAELLAVEQALILLDKLIATEPFLQDQTILLYFNTDSKFTVQALGGHIRKSTHRDMIERVRALTKRYVIVPRHVKGHTKGSVPREWVNNWCDQQARKLANERWRELNAKTTEKV